MNFFDIRDGRLFITQRKKGNKLAIAVDLALPHIGMTLNNVLELCRRDNPSKHFIYSAKRRHGRRPCPVRPENLTQAFMRIRARCGLDALPYPPTFHAIRSLSARLYEAHYGQEFTQRLLGHKNLTMIHNYFDSRGDAYVLV